MRTTVVLAFAAALVALPAHALACGVSSPGSPAGVCDASEVLDAKAALSRPYRVGASGAYTTTALNLSDGTRLDMVREAAVVTGSLRVGQRFNVELSGGALVGGSLGALSLRPGALASVSGSYRAIDQRGQGTPFLLFTGVVAFMLAGTSDGKPLGAMDLRVGAMVGTTLGKPHRATLTPYLAAQVFGGPVYWSHAIDATHAGPVTGTDVYHYGLGGGLAAGFDRVGLFAGGSALGEKSLTFGASLSF